MKRLRKFFGRLRNAWRVLVRRHYFVVFYDKDVSEEDVARTTSILAAAGYLNGKAADGSIGDMETSARLWIILHALTLQDDLLLYWRNRDDGQCYAAWACESDERLQELLSLTVDNTTGNQTL